MYKPVQSKSNHQYIVDELKKMVLTGALKVGDKLPPERELAELYQVSRTSIREALKSLEALGLLEIHQGDGNYITNNLEEKNTDLLSLAFVLNECKMSDLTWLRYSFELNSLSYYAGRKNPEEIALFKELLDKIDAASTCDELVALDFNTHSLISDMEENKLFSFLHSSIYTLYNRNVEFSNARGLTIDEGNIERTRAYVRELPAAIVTADIEKIKTALFKHYDYNYKAIDDKYAEYVESLTAEDK